VGGAGANQDLPRELVKALSGYPHSLSRDDITRMAKLFSWLPFEILLQEVECRLESWVLDLDGRRDFQHALNVSIRHWMWSHVLGMGGKNGAKTSNTEYKQDEQRCWRQWKSLPEGERVGVKARIVDTIIGERRAELLMAERTKQTITKELFWRYEAENKELILAAGAAGKAKTKSWSVWLTKHIEEFKTSLDRFCDSKQLRQQRYKDSHRSEAALAENSAQSPKRSAGVGGAVSSSLDAHVDPDAHPNEVLSAIHALRRRNAAIAEREAIAEAAAARRRSSGGVVAAAKSVEVAGAGAGAGKESKESESEQIREEKEKRMLQEVLAPFIKLVDPLAGAFAVTVPGVPSMLPPCAVAAAGGCGGGALRSSLDGGLCGAFTGTGTGVGAGAGAVPEEEAQAVIEKIAKLEQERTIRSQRVYLEWVEEKDLQNDETRSKKVRNKLFFSYFFICCFLD
jgi:hypothetical protein